MSSRDKFLVIWAILGGLGGLVNTLLYSDIVAALNTRRPPDDPIPFGITSWDDFRKTRIGAWSYWKVLREFRREFPDSKLDYWSIVSAAGMFLLFAIAAGFLFR
jgi:hypothetical protein